MYSLLIAPEMHRPAATLLLPTVRPYVWTLSPSPLSEDSQPITLDQCLATLPIPGAHLTSWGAPILTHGTSKWVLSTRRPVMAAKQPGKKGTSRRALRNILSLACQKGARVWRKTVIAVETHWGRLLLEDSWWANFSVSYPMIKPTYLPLSFSFWRKKAKKGGWGPVVTHKKISSVNPIPGMDFKLIEATEHVDFAFSDLFDRFKNNHWNSPMDQKPFCIDSQATIK